MASLQEVARRAKVSIATVSRVLNKSDKVAAETRAAVEKALRELGYRPSRVARRLRMKDGRAHLVGLIIPDIQNPFYAEIARGVEDAAYAAEYALLLCNSDENPEKERFYLEVMRSESVDGIVLPPFDDTDSAVIDIVATGMPVVCVDRSMVKLKTDLVEVDNHRGAFEAVAHLLDKGHRHIGLIEGRTHVSTSRERRRGYLDALAERGVTVRKDLMRSGDFKQESGRVLANELLALRKPPTAHGHGHPKPAPPRVETPSRTADPRHKTRGSHAMVVGVEDDDTANRFAAQQRTQMAREDFNFG